MSILFRSPSFFLTVFVLFILTEFSFGQNPTVINDSLVVNNRVYAKEKLIVDKEAKFKEDIKVLGVARLASDLVVDGTAKLNGNVKMENLPTLSNLNMETFQVVIKTENGQLKTMNLGSFFLQGTAPNPPVSCQEVVGGVIVNPGWFTGVDKVYIECPSIRVGIGTSTPKHKLHVTGTSYSQKFLGGNVDASPTSSSAIFNGYSENTSQDLIRLGGKIGTNDEEVRFKIVNDGTVFAKELRIRAISDFPDYVFDEKYALMSLKDLANFISINHHLPNMPTAAEVKANGMAMGELTMKIVEKIEELTLHCITLNYENENLKEELKKQSLQINELREEINSIKDQLKK